MRARATVSVLVGYVAAAHGFGGLANTAHKTHGRSPMDPHSHSACVDEPNFADQYGDCDAYRRNTWCSDGQVGNAWQPSWGELGLAHTSCCACGGGVHMRSHGKAGGHAKPKGGKGGVFKSAGAPGQQPSARPPMLASAAGGSAAGTFMQKTATDAAAPKARAYVVPALMTKLLDTMCAFDAHAVHVTFQLAKQACERAGSNCTGIFDANCLGTSFRLCAATRLGARKSRKAYEHCLVVPKTSVAAGWSLGGAVPAVAPAVQLTAAKPKAAADPCDNGRVQQLCADVDIDEAQERALCSTPCAKYLVKYTDHCRGMLSDMARSVPETANYLDNLDKLCYSKKEKAALALPSAD